jgi:lipopolysaccharide transport system permease protein/teichoic acid transport system permease protein
VNSRVRDVEASDHAAGRNAEIGAPARKNSAESLWDGEALLEPPLYARRGPVREAWRQAAATLRYRPLIRYMVSSSLRTQNTGTIFGHLWWLLDPLLLMLVYVVLIDVVLERGGENYPLFVFIAVVAWKYFAATSRNAMALTVGKERLMRQVAFPKTVLPLSAVLGGTIHFAFALVVVVIFAVPFGIYPHVTLPLVLLVAAVQFVLTLGMSLFLSALNVFLRDVQNLGEYVFRMWFYLSPGLYAVAAVPENYREIYELNPFATLFPAYRSVLLDHSTPDFAALGVVGGFSLIVLVAAYVFFVRLEPSFTKVS